MLNTNRPPFGGAEYHFDLLRKLLERKGHSVAVFFFEEHASLGKRYLASQALEKFLQGKSFDIAHIHNQEYYYADCTEVLARHHLKIVTTLHDYRYICPDCICLKNGNETCEACFKGRYYRAVCHRYRNFFQKLLKRFTAPKTVAKGSPVASAANLSTEENGQAKPVTPPALKPGSCLEGINVAAHFEYMFVILRRYFLETLLGGDPMHISRISHFISPSRFLAEVFQRAGFPGIITHIDNFLPIATYQRNFPLNTEEPYILFAGRIVAEKGIMTLLDAVKGQNLRLRIAGKGPLEQAVQQRLNSENGFEKVTLEGFKSGDELLALIGGAQFNVVPSEWWETWGFSAAEPLALGRPALVAAMGALPEVVPNNAAEFFTPGNCQELRHKLLQMAAYPPEQLTAMGEAGRTYVLAHYNEEVYYEKLQSLYRQVLNNP